MDRYIYMYIYIYVYDTHIVYVPSVYTLTPSLLCPVCVDRSAPQRETVRD